MLAWLARRLPPGSLLRRRVNLAAAWVYRMMERLRERFDRADDAEVISFEVGEREAP